MSHDPIAKLASFENILDAIEQLGREHLLFYRLQVGELLLTHFWSGDAKKFSRPGPGKEARFSLFYEKHGEALARNGLSARQALDSIRAAIVMRTLPPELGNQLFLTQVLELTRLRDPTQRAKVAQAALRHDWSVRQLRTAVTAVRAGLALDTDPDAPGIQLPTLGDDERPPVPGRLVTQAEKLVLQVEHWSARWQQVDGSRLKREQRRRLKAAVVALEAQVAALKVGLEE